MTKVRKAVIPAAGLGTRFLPATKATPKEMLPIVDKPTLQFIVEEVIASGIKEILIISGRNKTSIEDHFDRSIELELNLAEKGKKDLLGIVEDISNLVDIHYVRQKKPLGLGHAIYCARTFVREEPFAVLLGDDIVKADPPCLQQLLNVHEERGGSILGVQEVPPEDVCKYGMVEYSQGDGHTYEVKDLVEKPPIGEAPSSMGILGRYIISPRIFSILEQTDPGVGGEIQLTDALRILAREEKVFAHIFKGKRYDAGSRMGYLQATIEYALDREDLRGPFTSYLKTLVKGFPDEKAGE